jgi:hypothetical protein
MPEKFCRAQLRAELDAYYARLYSLTRDELRYILDPKEVRGEDPSTPARSRRDTASGTVCACRGGQAQGRFPWRNFPCAEGEGNQAVWRRFAQDETSRAGGVG